VFTARLPAYQLLGLFMVTSCILVWFGWGGWERYGRTPQAAILHEEAFGSGQSVEIAGTVTWSLDGNGAKGVRLVADVVVPERGLEFTLLMRENRDSSQSREFLVEGRQRARKQADERIAEVGLPLVKKTSHEDDGVLVGSAKRVRDGYFLINLSPAPQDVKSNLGLLRRAGLIAVPLTYSSGRRATLTIIKGSPGNLLLRSAMHTWAQ